MISRFFVWWPLFSFKEPSAKQRKAQLAARTNIDSGGFYNLEGFAHQPILGAVVPSTFATVDVELNDNGDIFDTVIVAGIVGAQVSISEHTDFSGKGKSDTIAVSSEWWMCIKKT